MTLVKCRDCGREGSESPDDPAPALCPPCYDKRMSRVHSGFVRYAQLEDDPVKLATWLAEALHETGGETLHFARKHASELLLQAMMTRG
jgi:hypothetical protein